MLCVIARPLPQASGLPRLPDGALSAPVCLSVFRAVVQIKDAVRDGLRAVKNVIDDKAVVLGAGAFEVAAAQHLRETVKKQVRRQRVAGLKDTSSREALLACEALRSWLAHVCAPGITDAQA